MRGALVFAEADDGLQLRAPGDVTLANDGLIPDDLRNPTDISEHWYLIANGVGSGIDLVSIDLHADRLGRCYDSFWDVHASPGDCAVVATSFTDLLRRVLDGPRDHWWWTADDSRAWGTRTTTCRGSEGITGRARCPPWVDRLSRRCRADVLLPREVAVQDLLEPPTRRGSGTG